MSAIRKSSKKAVFLQSVVSVIALLGVASEAHAVCTTAGPDVTCDAAVTSTEANAKIDAVTPPNLNLTVKATGTVDTKAGSVVVPTKLNGVIKVVNDGVIGSGAVFATPGLTVNGTVTETKNTVTITNSNTIKGGVAVNNAGGTVTVTLNKGLEGPLTLSGAGDVIVGGPDASASKITADALGATTTKVAGAVTTNTITSGNVKIATGDVAATGGALGAVKATSAAGAVDVTTTGKAASLTATAGTAKNSIVEASTATDAAGVKTVVNNLTTTAVGGASTVSVAAGSAITGAVASTGVGGSTVTIKGAVDGAASSKAGGTTVVANSTTVTQKTGASVTTTTGSTTQNVAAASLTIEDTGVVKGAATVAANGAATATIAGKAASIAVTNDTLNTTNASVVSKDDKGALIEQTTKSTVAATGGAATLAVSKSGVVTGKAGVTTLGDAKVDVAGTVGGVVTVTSVSNQKVDFAQTIKQTPGTLNASTTTAQTTATLGGKVNLTVAEGASVGGVTASAAGAVDATLNGKVGNAVAAGNVFLLSAGLKEVLNTSVVTTVDAKTGGQTVSETSKTVTNTGSTVKVTQGATGEIGVAGGAAPTTTLLGTKGVTATFAGKNTGALNVTSQATDSTEVTKTVTNLDKAGVATGDFTQTSSVTNAAVGGSAALTLSPGSATGAIIVAADGKIDATLGGEVKGASSFTASRGVIAKSDTTTTVATAGDVKTTTQTQAVNSVQAGDNVSVTVGDFGLTGLLALKSADNVAYVSSGKTGSVSLDARAIDQASTLKTVATVDAKTGNTTNTTSNVVTKTVSGGDVTATLATGAVNDGALLALGHKAITANVSGTVKGGLTATSAEDVATFSDTQAQSSLTIDKTAGVTVNKAAQQTVTKTATQGGVVNVATGAGGDLQGVTAVSGRGGVTLNNAGQISGKTTLTSAGTDVVETANTSTTTTTTLTVPADATKGSTVKVDQKGETTKVVTANGGSVTTTSSGAIGTAIAPVAVTQTANGTSEFNLVGTLFGNVNASTAANNSKTTTSETSTKTQTLDGGGAVLSGTTTSVSTLAIDSTQTGGASTITVVGQARESVGGVASNLTATAQGAATVKVAGGRVDGAVKAQSASATQAVTNKIEDTRTTGAAGVLTAGTQNRTTTTTTKSTAGAANVTLSNGVVSSATAIGASATVALDAASKINGAATAQVAARDSDIATKIVSTFNAGTKLWDTTSTTTTVDSRGAVAGDATVLVAGQVAGKVTADAAGGAAKIDVVNKVANEIDARSVAFTLKVEEKTVGTAAFAGGITTKSSFDRTATSTATPNATATVTLKAPTGFGAGALVTGPVNATAVKTATVTIAADTRIAQSATATAGSRNTVETLSQVFDKGALITEKSSSTVTNVAGTAVVENAGRADFTLAANALGGTARVTNTGTVNPDSFFGGGVAALTVGSLTSVQTEKTGLNDVAKFKSVETRTVTPVGGTVTAINSGQIRGNVTVGGAKGEVTNTGVIRGVISAGTSVDNWTSTSTTTSTVNTVKATVGPLLNQTYVINQNGGLLGGVFVGGAKSVNVLPGTGATVVTSNIAATVNLAAHSVTVGTIEGERDGLTRLTTTDVVLQNTGFLGYAGDKFFTQNAQVFGDPIVGAARVVGVRNLVKEGAGTFYIVGLGYSVNATPTAADDVTNNTASPVDDYFDIDVANFTINGGRVEFTTPQFTVTQTTPRQPFGIRGNVTNGGEFVLGWTGQGTGATNINNLTARDQTYVNGVTFRIDGNFTQSAGGTLIAGFAPTLARSAGPTGTTLPELTSAANFNVAISPFSTPNKLFGQPLNGQNVQNPLPSFVQLNGNLDLAGTVQLNVWRGGLYDTGDKTTLIRATGTVNNTAKVVTTANSPFVTFGLTTTKVGAETEVALTATRTGYATVAPNANAAAAGKALDAAFSPTVQAIRRDANGEAVFTSVGAFRQAQDLANVYAVFDWFVPAASVGGALHEIASGEFYGSLSNVDTSRGLQLLLNAPLTHEQRTATRALWQWTAAPSYLATNFDGSGGVTGLDVTQSGIAFGGTLRPGDNWIISLGAGYEDAQVDGSERPVSADIQSFQFGGAVTYQFTQSSLPFYVGGSLSYTASSYDVTREMRMLARTASASFDGSTLRYGLHAGVDFENAVPGVLTVFGELANRAVEIDSFSERETAGGLSLTVDGIDDDVFTGTLGARWSGELDWAGGTITPYGVLSYTFEDSDGGARLSLPRNVASFNTQGISSDGFATIGGGVSGVIGQSGFYRIEATGQFGDGRDALGLGVTGGFRF